MCVLGQSVSFDFSQVLRQFVLLGTTATETVFIKNFNAVRQIDSLDIRGVVESIRKDVF